LTLFDVNRNPDMRVQRQASLAGRTDREASLKAPEKREKGAFDRSLCSRFVAPQWH
jgi:hypothetical protein